MVNVTINGIPVSVPEGSTILDATRAAGCPVPTLCFLKDINEIAACRVCVVELEGADHLITACNNVCAEGIPIRRGVIEAKDWTAVEHAPGVFAGGDCVTGPKTAIRAIAAGKVAAANIDNFLGFNHVISVDVEIPEPSLRDHKYCGRVNLTERSAAERKDNFDLMEQPMTERAAQQEASRCLRCDHFGCGNFKGGRAKAW